MICFIKLVMLFSSRLKTDSSWFSLQTTATWMWMKYWCHWTLLQPPATQPMALSVVKAAVWVNVNLILCSILVIALWCQQSRRTRLSSDVQADVALRHPDRLHRKSLQRLTGSLLASFSETFLLNLPKKCQSPLLKKVITQRKMLEVSQSLFNFTQTKRVLGSWIDFETRQLRLSLWPIASSLKKVIAVSDSDSVMIKVKYNVDAVCFNTRYKMFSAVITYSTAPSWKSVTSASFTSSHYLKKLMSG